MTKPPAMNSEPHLPTPHTPQLRDLFKLYGRTRTIRHHTDHARHEDYTRSLAAGQVKRESGVRTPEDTWALTIRVIAYTDPITLHPRYALDLWSSPTTYRTDDHHNLKVITALYEYVVRSEAKRLADATPTDYYDVTDVS